MTGNVAVLAIRDPISMFISIAMSAVGGVEGFGASTSPVEETKEILY